MSRRTNPVVTLQLPGHRRSKSAGILTLRQATKDQNSSHQLIHSSKLPSRWFRGPNKSIFYLPCLLESTVKQSARIFWNWSWSVAAIRLVFSTCAVDHGHDRLRTTTVPLSTEVSVPSLVSDAGKPFLSKRREYSLTASKESPRHHNPLGFVGKFEDS